MVCSLISQGLELLMLLDDTFRFEFATSNVLLDLLGLGNPLINIASIFFAILFDLGTEPALSLRDLG